MTSRTDPAHGFTLLEVLVVLLVLALAAGIVAGRGPVRSPALTLRAAANDLARTLRIARTRAITTNRPTLLRFDLPSHSFALDADTPHQLPPTAAITLTTAAPGASNPQAIAFAPDGSSTGGQVRLSENDLAITVDTAWLTGRISLHAR